MNCRRIMANFVLLLALPGCAAIATYAQDRVRDLSDVIDVRYGTGLGLGWQAQALWLETGLGGSTESYYRQWFGRKSVEVTDGLFAQVLIVGVDGDFWRRERPHVLGDSSTGVLSVLVFNLTLSSSLFSWAAPDEVPWFESPAGDVPILDCFRIGGTLFVPGVSGGLYLNFGELADFLGGLVGYDLVHDDGIAKFRSIAGAPQAGATPE